MNSVTPFITFSSGAEDAAELYVSLIRNSRITGSVRAPDDSYSLVYFELDGRPFTAMNGGPTFSFATGFSLFAQCEDQEEVDRIWNGFIEKGGQPGQCGWLLDPFGVSWQVIPKRFLELSGDADPEKVSRVIAAMLKMNKLIVSDLEAAAQG